jgi:hypothetical protein
VMDSSALIPVSARPRMKRETGNEESNGRRAQRAAQTKRAASLSGRGPFAGKRLVRYSAALRRLAGLRTSAL